MIVLLVLIICCLIFIIVAGLLLVRRVNRMIRDGFMNIEQFVTSPDTQTPSPLAQSVMALAEGIAPVIAQSLSQSLMSSVKGQISGAVRGLAAVESEVTQGAIAQGGNPVTMLLAGALQKQIKKNPMLGAALMNLDFGNLFGHKSASVPSNGRNQSSQFKFG